jgi:hypothetical protein
MTHPSSLYISSIDFDSSICETHFAILYKLLDINQISMTFCLTLNVKACPQLHVFFMEIISCDHI